jgi:outer membrane protein TolC
MINRKEIEILEIGWLMGKRWIFMLLLTFSCQYISSPLLAQTLGDYLREAAENNPDINASYLNFEAAMKRVSQVNALPDPSLSFGYFISPIETRVGAQKAKITLTQMFPWFGTLRAKEDAATLMAEARYQEFLKDKFALYLDVKHAYYPIYEIMEHLNWQNENLLILESYKRLATIAYANGKGAMADVLQVDIMIDEVKTTIQLLKDNLIPKRMVFNRLLNRPDTSMVLVQDLLLLEAIDRDYRKDSIASQNPMLKTLQLKIQALKVQETIEQKNSLPQFGIGLDYALIGKRSGVNMSDNGKNAFMPMVTMSLPIFRKKYNAAIGEQQLLQQSLEKRRQGLENKLHASYASVYFELEKSLQLNALYDKQIEKTQQVLRLRYSAYGNSGQDFDALLRTQQQLLKYEMAKATATKNYFLALAEIDYITAKSA